MEVHMETKDLKYTNDEMFLQTEDEKTKVKLLDELNKQMQGLSQANTKKQNLDLQLEIEAENLKKFNEKPLPEISSSDPSEEEDENDDEDINEEKSVCEFCGSDEHDSPCPRLELT